MPLGSNWRTSNGNFRPNKVDIYLFHTEVCSNHTIQSQKFYVYPFQFISLGFLQYTICHEVLDFLSELVEDTTYGLPSFDGQRYVWVLLWQHT